MSEGPTKQHAMIMWIIWFAYLQSMLAIQFFIGGGIPSGDNIAEPMPLGLWVAAICPALIAITLRWSLMHKLRQPAQQLPALIVGLALSELPLFISLFLVGSDYPQNQIVILMIAFFSGLQYAPIYATPGMSPEA